MTKLSFISWVTYVTFFWSRSYICQRNTTPRACQQTIRLGPINVTRRPIVWYLRLDHPSKPLWACTHLSVHCWTRRRPSHPHTSTEQMQIHLPQCSVCPPALSALIPWHKHHKVPISAHNKSLASTVFVYMYMSAESHHSKLDGQSIFMASSRTCIPFSDFLW